VALIRALNCWRDNQLGRCGIGGKLNIPVNELNIRAYGFLAATSTGQPLAEVNHALNAHTPST
jgi:hypothetical protein